MRMRRLRCCRGILRGCAGRIEATPVVLAIWNRESEIDRLYRLSASVKKGADDRVRREQSAEAARAGAVEFLASIGVRMELDAAWGCGLRIRCRLVFLV